MYDPNPDKKDKFFQTFEEILKDEKNKKKKDEDDRIRDLVREELENNSISYDK